MRAKAILFLGVFLTIGALSWSSAQAGGVRIGIGIPIGIGVGVGPAYAPPPYYYGYPYGYPYGYGYGYPYGYPYYYPRPVYAVPQPVYARRRRPTRRHPPLTSRRLRPPAILLHTVISAGFVAKLYLSGSGSGDDSATAAASAAFDSPRPRSAGRDRIVRDQVSVRRDTTDLVETGRVSPPDRWSDSTGASPAVRGESAENTVPGLLGNFCQDNFSI